LPENSAAPDFSQGQNLFSSADGTFRLIFIRAKNDLAGYRECTDWFNAIKQIVAANLPATNQIQIGYTGRPAFVAEISGSMKHDITLSAGGTSVIIAILFWLAHRRIKPMLWLLTLLALILAATLALGGLIFGAINVISMGFAAILLGLAVDYAVVHYQEALAHPDLTIPEVRRAIAPAIFWAAVTTISAFLVLNFGGLPGLAQLGSLVGIGVALSAFVMIFAFLPPLFPSRRTGVAPVSDLKPNTVQNENISRLETGATPVLRCFTITTILILFCAVILSHGLPKMDASADALHPRNSQAYATLDAIKTNLGQEREPLWLVIAGQNENAVAQKLAAIEPILENAVFNGTLASFDSPNSLWPRPDFQNQNRAIAQKMIYERAAFHTAAASNGFAESSLDLAEEILATWQRAILTTNVFWPTNPLDTWIFEKISASETNQFLAAAFLFPATNATTISISQLDSQLPRDGVWLSGWEFLGGTVLAAVKSNLWKLLLPMAGLILLSLRLAFRRFAEIFFSISILLLSGFCLLAVMKILGWQWNLLNLMALPLILGTGVDYSIFMQLSLRRCHGDLSLTHRSVGRALLLCGGTAIAGFGSLGLSSNAGMSSLGQVCAVGIAGNMLISVFLLPIWWKIFSPKSKAQNPKPPVSTPSSFYSARFWQIGLVLAKSLPKSFCNALAKMVAEIYWRLAPQRREIVTRNLLPILGDRKLATRAARELFTEFALKLVSLWRHEGGAPFEQGAGDWNGWEHFTAAHARGKGVLLVTPHLGNWEFGSAFMVEHGCKLLVLTQPEPDARLTELRRLSRTRRGVETLVVGEDAFAFVEIIRRLQEGATVALLVDRPPAPTAVGVKLFGRNFSASIAAAELARASGCAIVPGYIVRRGGNFFAQMLPEIKYDRAAIGNRDARIELTQQILRAFEPIIRQHRTQWFHFVPIWPGEKSK
jgi:predicted exporter/lauroyl/myristoyl acyltransferase